ncbi:hypothetical protein F183_A19830 [Bryobacterales bacterium F-183]|nr:hypothetical protein F183_A19830 [Bryobacterales bacterium F-183]
MNPTAYREVKRIVGEALDLTRGPKRDAYLDDAFSKDPELREEVLTLIAACEESNAGFLERRQDRDKLIGQRAGPYRFEEKIGEGGMGAVYRAVREDGAFRMVTAIKVIREGLDSAGISKRFRNERQILARLSHPNIARLLDGGVTNCGRPFFVMEYVDGQRMSDVAAKLGLHQKLDIFRILCNAVHYAHQNLVIHGDIKANNVLVTADGTPKLLDFGVARLSEPEANSGLTVTYLPPAFTPDYASPEQVRGEMLSTASDVYSLGVLLCELLTGKRPRSFTSSNPQVILTALQTASPKKPSELAEDPGPLRGDLDNIVMKALEVDPRQRYASAEQLAEDIRRYESGLPVMARPDSLRYRAGKFVRRNLVAVVAATAGVLALTAGLATAIHQARIARIEKQRAERMFNGARELANSFIFEIEREIAKLPGSTTARATLVSRATRYLDGLARDSEGNPVLQRELAAAYVKLGEVLGRPDAANLGDSAGSLDSFRKAVQIREELARSGPGVAEYQEELADAYNRYAALLRVKGDYKASLDYDRKALEICETLTSQDPKNPARRRRLAEAYTAVGGSLSQLGRWDEVLEVRRKPLEIYRALVQQEPSRAHRAGLALAGNRMASILSHNGRKAEAVKQYREVLALRKALAEEKTAESNAKMNLAGTQLSLGTLLSQMGQYAEASQLLQASVAAFGAMAEADSKDARSHSLLATAYLRQAEHLEAAGSPQAALPLLGRSKAIRERLAEANPLNAGARGEVAEILAAIGKTYEGMGRREQALKAQRQAVEIATEIESSGRANAVIHGIREKAAEAVARLEKAAAQ